MKRDELLAFIDTRLDAAFGELGAALAAETDDPDVAAAIPLHMFVAANLMRGAWREYVRRMSMGEEAPDA